MITLFLHTAGGPSSVAITRDGIPLTESLLATEGKRQNNWLLPELERLLAACDLGLEQIDLLACSVGPGAFTGIRTGVAAIQGLALASGKPCVGVSSLALLALNLPHAPYPVCPLLDARKNEVYAGLYRCDGLPQQQLLPDQAVAPQRLLEQLDGPTIFLGDGALRYRDLITETVGQRAIFAPASHQIPRPSCGALLAEQLFSQQGGLPPEQLLPAYLRLSEAEIMRRNRPA